MWFLIGVIILILFVLVVYLIITYKIKKYFHKSIFEIISAAKKEDEQLPKSLSSMDSIYLEGIKKDFPDLNINELKRKAEQIILDSLSAIEKKNSSKIKEEKLKAYVESVKVSRKLPSEITIEVTERKPSFMLEVGNAYVYMNTQGYFLEISENKLELPVILGYQTELDEIKPGKRLIKEDLQKLETVLRIMKSAQTNGIADKITRNKYWK